VPPHFLCDLRSAKDRASVTAAGQGTLHGQAAARSRRHGLFRHLRWFQWPDRFWTNGMHATALQVLSSRQSMAKPAFVIRCADELKERRNVRSNGISWDELEQLLGLLYDARVGRAE